MVRVMFAAAPPAAVRIHQCSVTLTAEEQRRGDRADVVHCTLSWTMSDPHALLMFGKTSDHPADVQFLLMLPVREEERQ